MALLLAEGAVRVFAPHSRDHVLPGRLFDLDERLGWKLKPNRQVTHRTRYFDVTYTINESGFRDRTRDGSTDRDVYRLLLYGDSQVFGWGVAEERRFSNLLERSFRSLEIWNLAVPAYGLDQQLLSYGLSDATPDADEVIFFVAATTLYRSHHRSISGKPKPMFVMGDSGVLRAMPPRTVGIARWFYEALSPLYLPQFVNRRVAMMRWDLEEAREQRELDSRIAPSKGRIGDFDLKLLTLGLETATTNGHRMTILAALPDDASGDLRDFCGRHDIGLIAVDPERMAPDFVFGRDDPHWTLAGHRWVAEQILSQVSWGTSRAD